MILTAFQYCNTELKIRHHFIVKYYFIDGL
jgi:hypothetical protein